MTGEITGKLVDELTVECTSSQREGRIAVDYFRPWYGFILPDGRVRYYCGEHSFDVRPAAQIGPAMTPDQRAKLFDTLAAIPEFGFEPDVAAPVDSWRDLLTSQVAEPTVTEEGL